MKLPLVFSSIIVIANQKAFPSEIYALLQDCRAVTIDVNRIKARSTIIAKMLEQSNWMHTGYKRKARNDLSQTLYEELAVIYICLLIYI